jgi:hypothetical protein
VALDVYVGTLTRFYRRDWENVVERMAREKGTRYMIIHAGGEPEPPPPANEIRLAIEGWREALSQSLRPHGIGPVDWEEADSTPYFSDRPRWHGYSGLLVWAAHAEHPDLPLPAEAPESWAGSTAYERSTARDFKSQYQTILEPQMWLPTEFPFVFEAPTLVSEKACIGSAFTLKKQLDELHLLTEVQLKELKRKPTAKAETAQRNRLLSRLLLRTPPRPEPVKPGLADVAEVGLAVFRKLAAKACEHRLPMFLDY